MGKICDRCDTEMSVTFRKGTERICVDCHNKEIKERQTSEADVRLNNLLTGLVELKPQLVSKEHGPEPSIRELVEHYYKTTYCEDGPELTEQYLKILFTMAS